MKSLKSSSFKEKSVVDNFVVIGDIEVTYDNNKHSSLLECLEANGQEVLYHCREGYCGACRVKIIKGSVDYFIDPLAFIDDDEVLPCCCTPVGRVCLEN